MFSGIMFAMFSGSSPLARGTHPVLLEHLVPLRFIPARAGNTRRRGRLRAPRAVHPRSRGEHARRHSLSCSSSGSSPLARGTLAQTAAGVRVLRFIPARAGNTGRHSVHEAPASVHPRSRGEHARLECREWRCSGSSPLARGTLIRSGRVEPHLRFIPARAGNTAKGSNTLAERHGSSPLARGTPDGGGRHALRLRFIPARAGNTLQSTSPLPEHPVHPRSRGEHFRGRPDFARCTGSSPLARGTPGEAEPADGGCRFIPARAGNTPPRPSPPRPTAVHPRSRGEHGNASGAVSAGTGSSPLARGTRGSRDETQRSRRFIPARAGNTPGTRIHPTRISGSSPLARGTLRGHASIRRGSAVHPRSRGEHLIDTRQVADKTGSSPLARGTRDRVRVHARASRFIPARAGNTPSACCPPPCRTVHPRSRGEHAKRSVSRQCHAGSSPLARGTLRQRYDALTVQRFIPARAGNTISPSPGTRPISVHPRSRGEHVGMGHHATRRSGSSPLARGTRYSPARSAPRGRFIPARAGNTHALPAGPE